MLYCILLYFCLILEQNLEHFALNSDINNTYFLTITYHPQPSLQHAQKESKTTDKLSHKLQP